MATQTKGKPKKETTAKKAIAEEPEASPKAKKSPKTAKKSAPPPTKAKKGAAKTAKAASAKQRAVVEESLDSPVASSADAASTDKDTKAAPAKKAKAAKAKTAAKSKHSRGKDDAALQEPSAAERKAGTAVHKKWAKGDRTPYGFWRRMDRRLTVGVVLLLALMVAGVAGINAGVRSLGGGPIHFLDPTSLYDRGRGMLFYLGARLGPPARRAPSLGYEREIQEAAIRHRVSSHLIKAVIRVESDFHPWRLSRRGAVGLMQVMPDTARSVGVTRHLFRPEQNIHAGAAYLRRMLDRFRSLPMALAAYNAGPTLVARLRAIPNNHETPRYVRRVLAEKEHFTRDPGQEIRRAAVKQRRLTPAASPSLLARLRHWRKQRPAQRP